MAQIFISYARKDEAFVHQLAQDLRRRGIDLWLDQLDLAPGGQRWDDQIEAALKRCRYLLVVLSPASVTSQNVKDEIGFALDEGKPIIPVLYQACNIPFRIRRFQYTDFQGEYSEALAKLLQVLPASHPGEPTPASEAKVSETESISPGKPSKKPDKVTDIVQSLTYLIEIATGSTEQIDQLTDFVKSTNWYGGDTGEFLEKMSAIKQLTGYELLDKYSANAKMQINVAGIDISLPQELITNDIQGNFDDVFVTFERDTLYNREPFRYEERFEQICSGLEEKRISVIKQSGKSLFNGANLRLSNLEIVEKEGKLKIKTSHQPVYYFSGLGTNYSLDEILSDGKTTLRDLVHGEGKLESLDASILANPIGLNLLIISRDRHIILQQRGMGVSVRPGEACSSVSGTVDKDDAGHIQYHPILRAIYRETVEEIGLERNQLGGIFFLGAVREFLRGGLPDFFFATKVDLRQDEILHIAERSGKARDAWEWEDIPNLEILPSPLTSEKGKTFESYLKKYIDMLLRLKQPPSLPLLTNIVLLAKFQNQSPSVL